MKMQVENLQDTVYEGSSMNMRGEPAHRRHVFEIDGYLSLVPDQSSRAPSPNQRAEVHAEFGCDRACPRAHTRRAEGRQSSIVAFSNDLSDSSFKRGGCFDRVVGRPPSAAARGTIASTDGVAIRRN